MYKILLSFWFACISITAFNQKKVFFQFVFEPGLTNVPSFKNTSDISYYSLLDSSTGKFQKNSKRFESQIIGKRSVSLNGGVRLVYPVNNTVNLGVGLLIHTSSLIRIEKKRNISNVSTIEYHKRVNNIWVDANGNPLDYGLYFFQANQTNGTKFKIKLLSIRVPMNIIYSFPRSKFSVNAEICPDIYLIAKESGGWRNNPDVDYFYYAGTTNLLSLQGGLGFNYKVSDNFSIGITYARMLKSIYSRNLTSIKTQNIGVRMLFSIPSKRK